MEEVSVFWMYVIAMIPDIKGAFKFLTIVSGAGIALLMFIKLMMTVEGDSGTIKKRFIIPAVSVFIISGACYSAIPNYQQLAFIVGGHWAINNEDLREMPDNVAKIVNGYLEEINEGLEED